MIVLDSSSRKQILDDFDEPFADLQRDVAGEPVADDDVGRAAVDVARLDVADEGERATLSAAGAPRASARCPCVSSSPIDSSADAGRLDAERDARIDAAHDRELQQVRRPAFDAARRHRAGSPAACASESSPPAPDGPTPGSMPNAPCAAITVAPVWPALKSAAASPARHGIGGHLDRRGRLPPERRGGRLGHLDRVVRVDDAEPRCAVGAGVPIALRPRARAVGPTSSDAEIEVPRRRERAVDDVARAPIAAHGVDRDPDHRKSVNARPLSLRPPPAPVGRGSSRSSRRRDAAAWLVAVRALAEAHRPSARRACGAWPSASWSVVVSDSA